MYTKYYHSAEPKCLGKTDCTIQPNFKKPAVTEKLMCIYV